jgi:hypothetical protein
MPALSASPQMAAIRSAQSGLVYRDCNAARYWPQSGVVAQFPLSAFRQPRQSCVQLQRKVVMESAVSDIFAAWPAHATVTSLASPGFVSTSTSEPSEFFAAV